MSVFTVDRVPWRADTRSTVGTSTITDWQTLAWHVSWVATRWNRRASLADLGAGPDGSEPPLAVGTGPPS